MGCGDPTPVSGNPAESSSSESGTLFPLPADCLTLGLSFPSGHTYLIALVVVIKYIKQDLTGEKKGDA